MTARDYLTDQFLIAMPSLEDPNFSRSVTYICEHNEDGALGIVINRPTELTLADLLEQMDLSASQPAFGRRPVYLGGPVQRERGFVLHPAGHEWDSTLVINRHIAVTTSRDVIAALARGEGPEQCLIALGYAGWAAGQLEDEIKDNAWLSGPAESDIMFRWPHDERWRGAAAGMGVDMALLTGFSGHA